MILESKLQRYTIYEVYSDEEGDKAIVRFTEDYHPISAVINMVNSPLWMGACNDEHKFIVEDSQGKQCPVEAKRGWVVDSVPCSQRSGWSDCK